MLSAKLARCLTPSEIRPVVTSQPSASYFFHLVSRMRAIIAAFIVTICRRENDMIENVISFIATIGLCWCVNINILSMKNNCVCVCVCVCVCIIRHHILPGLPATAGGIIWRALVRKKGTAFWIVPVIKQG